MSVWERPLRKERSTLTVDQIVSTAMTLLDEEGIDALSMRKLATRLGVGATSLYWHVRNRDELVVLLIDAAWGELQVPEDGKGEWREVVTAVANEARSTTLRHPWLASVLDQIVSAYPGPNMSRFSERLLAVFEGAGFPLREADKAFTAVMSYVSGSAMAEASMHTWLSRQGTTGEEWLEESVLASEAAAVNDEHPRLGELAAAYRGGDIQAAMDEDFAYGLERMLDGLHARLERVAESDRG